MQTVTKLLKPLSFLGAVSYPFPMQLRPVWDPPGAFKAVPRPLRLTLVHPKMDIPGYLSFTEGVDIITYISRNLLIKFQRPLLEVRTRSCIRVGIDVSLTHATPED